jgi:hypothetical protein
MSPRAISCTTQYFNGCFQQFFAARGNDPAIGMAVEGISFPVGNQSSYSLHYRDEGKVIGRFQSGLDYEITVP